MPKKSTTERRARVLELIERLGIWNVPIKGLAEEYSVTRATIYKDIKKLIENMPKDAIDVIYWGCCVA